MHFDISFSMKLRVAIAVAAAMLIFIAKDAFPLGKTLFAFSVALSILIMLPDTIGEGSPLVSELASRHGSVLASPCSDGYRTHLHQDSPWSKGIIYFVCAGALECRYCLGSFLRLSNDDGK
jgi:hypothetical protein